MLESCCRFLLVGSWLFISGCAMCSSCDDETYTTTGGIWERLDPVYGRVGSAFTPEVGMRVDMVPGDGTWSGEEISPGEPTPANEPPAELDNQLPLPADPFTDDPSNLDTTAEDSNAVDSPEMELPDAEPMTTESSEFDSSASEPSADETSALNAPQILAE